MTQRLQAAWAPLAVRWHKSVCLCVAMPHSGVGMFAMLIKLYMCGAQRPPNLRAAAVQSWCCAATGHRSRRCKASARRKAGACTLCVWGRKTLRPSRDKPGQTVFGDYVAQAFTHFASPAISLVSANANALNPLPFCCAYHNLLTLPCFLVAYRATDLQQPCNYILQSRQEQKLLGMRMRQPWRTAKPS